MEAIPESFILSLTSWSKEARIVADSEDDDEAICDADVFAVANISWACPLLWTAATDKSNKSPNDTLSLASAAVASNRDLTSCLRVFSNDVLTSSVLIQRIKACFLVVISLNANRARKSTVKVRACLVFFHPAAWTSPTVIPSTTTASDTTDVMASALRSAAEIPLSVAPRQIKVPSSNARTLSSFSWDVNKDLAPGLVMIDTSPSSVEMVGILRRRPPDVSINV
mmetsp:Transcript_14466/g.27124  ORF Transcript_14466/g.27124 Transcript_14466/m.27124 type:complete len:225 (+) Transcript_14466:230-904(+)